MGSFFRNDALTSYKHCVALQLKKALMAENCLDTFIGRVTSVVVIENHLLLFLLCFLGVYVPPGAGIGPGGTGPGTGFFPGNTVCLDSLNKNNPEHSHNRQGLFVFSRYIAVKLCYCRPDPFD